MNRFAPSVACLLTAGSLQAHEIGGTHVTLNLAADQSFSVDIETDAASLVEKLENASGLPRRSSDGSASEGGPRRPSSGAASEGGAQDAASLQDRLRALDQAFLSRVNLSFDGVALAPEVSYAVHQPVDSQEPPRASIRLAGIVPFSARTLEWSYAWTFTPYAFAVSGSDRQTETTWPEGARSTVVTLAQRDRLSGRLQTAWLYLRLGFTHIVPGGLDHVLFVLGICLLNRRLRPVLWQVSAFTVAHSITLGLGIYRIVPIAPRLVEPLIAASIVYVAVENILVSELTRRRVAIVFAFGLLHGLGFAGVLGGLGLPPAEFVTALAAFNIGVEAGQLAVIAAAFLLVIRQCRAQSWYRSRVVVPVSLGIACVSMYWAVERLAPLWS